VTVTVRALALAGLAVLVVAAVVVYLVWPRNHHNPSSGGPWFTALAAPYAPSTATRTSACGVTIGPGTLGVGHPRLPCGTQIEIEFQGKDVDTRVIDRGATRPGLDFEVTQALARELGLHGTQTIHWRLAR